MARGESHFISVFRFLANMYERNLQDYVQTNGGPDALLHYGRKNTKVIHMEFYFGKNSYEFSLKPTLDNRLIFAFEKLCFTDLHKAYDGSPHIPSATIIQSGDNEASLKNSSHKYAQYIKPAIESWRVYHFHDTSDTATVKQIHSATDNLKLKTDAANLAAFLMRLKRVYPKNYQQIVRTIRLVAPFFADFVLRENADNVQLEWFEQGNPDTPFKAHVLSDGTLRFICLATLLLQPFRLMSDTVINRRAGSRITPLCPCNSRRFNQKGVRAKATHHFDAIRRAD